MKMKLEGFRPPGLGPSRKERRAAWNYYEVNKTNVAGEEEPFFMTLGVDLTGPSPGIGVGRLQYYSTYTWAYTLIRGEIDLDLATDTVKVASLFIVYAKWSEQGVLEPLPPDISEILAWEDDPGIGLRNYPYCPENDENSSRYLILYRRQFTLTGTLSNPKTGKATYPVDIKLDLRNLPFHTDFGSWFTWPKGGLFLFVTCKTISGDTLTPIVQLSTRTYWNEPAGHK